MFRLTCVKNDIKHSCSAGSRCPLNSELDQLSYRVRQFEKELWICACVASKEGNGARAKHIFAHNLRSDLRNGIEVELMLYDGKFTANFF